jgi:hypothetical protein
MMRLTQIAGALTGLFLLAAAGTAAAQEQGWLKDRKYAEGIGYRLGDLELHPGLAGEFGYDSNMFLRADNENVVDVWRIRVTPSLSLSTLGAQRRAGAPPPKMTFSAGAAGTYNEYFDAGGGTEDVSSFRNFGANANADLTINPAGPVGGRLFGNVVRTVEPSNLSDTSAAYNRLNLRGGTELMWLPGGGLFDWRVGYAYDTELFEESRFESLNNGTHAISTRGRWRFLPKTALLFDASHSFVHYSDPGDSRYLLDSSPIRARVGLNGLLTNHLALLAMAGWGASFYEAGDVPLENYDGPIGQVQLTFYPTPAPALGDSSKEVSLTLSKISLGYHRDFQNSYFGGFYARDRGHLNLSYFFASRVLVVGEGGVARVGFPNLYFPDGTLRIGSFNETRFDASLFAEYRVIESVGVNATVSYVKNDSINLPVDPLTGDEENLSYDRVQAFVGARWFM